MMQLLKNMWVLLLERMAKQTRRKKPGRREGEKEEHGEGLGLGKEKRLCSNVDPPPTLTSSI